MYEISLVKQAVREAESPSQVAFLQKYAAQCIAQVAAALRGEQVRRRPAALCADLPVHTRLAVCVRSLTRGCSTYAVQAAGRRASRQTALHCCPAMQSPEGSGLLESIDVEDLVRTTSAQLERLE